MADQKIFVFTDNNIFSILSEDGKILETRHETFRTYFELGNTAYRDENISLTATDVPSNKDLWQVQIDDRFTQSPILDHGNIFLRTWPIPGYIYSIDQSTGKVNWKVSQDILSNLCIVGQKIYFISSDGYLITLDRLTGNEITKVRFLSQFDFTNGKGYNGYFIAADPANHVLVIYFRDNSQTLWINQIKLIQSKSSLKAHVVFWSCEV